MDPDRVRAYLQVACAGLGFDIGEIWWSSNEEGGGSTALATFGKFFVPRTRFICTSFDWPVFVL
jgi:hypothetical protein